MNNFFDDLGKLIKDVLEKDDYDDVIDELLPKFITLIKLDESSEEYNVFKDTTKEWLELKVKSIEYGFNVDMNLDGIGNIRSKDDFIKVLKSSINKKIIELNKLDKLLHDYLGDDDYNEYTDHGCIYCDS